ncbi:aminotransferase class I/II-fold pyridoxal phosphate-dependent enzyme [Paenibacillus tyrfis]|uniref:aminotransferase class I/II-fold pyridoxal phosphate-dependent enzyme n=1 Tax=Paenibacillus tyrfis TaxID=1501230 RepID=UPI00209F70FF|nr:aminotransferase class I/II-fold pyridoxal phosphate-dependent enzyme [Paenibacillus tyrfis]MCP1312257.1 aminotransferase class I/II-fold pyridoxal phosphate-dependent enzyme [Paenibacillus tyrfis]
MSQHRAPLYEALAAHRESGALSFHVPGHKSEAQGYAEAESDFRQILLLDRTEIAGLDDLHHPEEAIKEAQSLAAACFGADETFFLVNGSTAGNLAMILAACRRGDLLLVQRDAHKSVIHGLMLAGAQAVFISPLWDPESGLSMGVAAEDVEQALNRYPEAKGLLVTNPSYYGITSDLKALSGLLHDRGKVLLVDEAHGAHFGFHPDVPASALSCGADAVVQSTHKMLTAMTMGAMLHVQGPRIHRSAVRKALAMVQSSSPSYPIMASLDLSRRMLQKDGGEWIERGLSAARRVTAYLNGHSRWHARELTERMLQIGCLQDPFKVALYDVSGRLDGFALKERLEQQGCFPELADPTNVLLAFSLASTEEAAQQLIEALERIDEETRDEGNETKSGLWETEDAAQRISEPVTFDWEAIHEGTETKVTVPVAECAGRIAAEMIVPYPPGIPVLYPGERITERTAAHLTRLAALGSRFHGHDVSAGGTVPVLETRQVIP